jgi:uncharacterized protein YjdB
VTPPNPSIAAGQTRQFAASGAYSDGTSQDLTAIVAWTSGTPGTASITAGGLATALAAGTSTISAQLGLTSGSTTLTVVAAVLVSIAVTPSNAPWIQPGGTQQFNATATFSDKSTADVTSTATWSSANNLVATVGANTGKATGVAPGTAPIVATQGGVSGSANLTVTKATLASIAITPATPSIAAGNTLQLAATGTYTDGTTQDLTDSVAWASATASVATINPTTGLAVGVSAGTSNITATLAPGTPGNISLTVTGPVLTKIVVGPVNPSIPNGQTQQFHATGTFSDGTTQDLTSSATWNSSLPSVATVASSGLATAVASGGTLTLFAANPGQWGNNVQVNVTVQPGNSSRFGVQVVYNGRVVENFVNLSVLPADPQYVVTVIDNDSQYISFINPQTQAPVAPAGPPVNSSLVSLTGGADGTALVPSSDGNFELAMTSNPTGGVFLLDRVDIFNLLCVPAETIATTIQTLQAYCFAKRAFYIVDAPQTATTANLTTTGPVGSTPGSLTGDNSINSAYYFPWVQAPDPLFGNRTKLFPPSGMIAGIYAFTDANRGVWKAPAGIGASLSGVSGLQYVLTDQENGDLNIQAINCLRQFKVYGDVVWGARTLQGNDQAGSQWKYIPIRRLTLFLESSLYDGTQWVVFEPNDEALWGQIRLSINSFLSGLFQQGAFAGTSPQQAYFVKCDSENNTPASISLGIVNILVGFAPLYPAEFVVIQIQQMAGQAQA